MNYEANYTAAIDMWSIGCIIAEFFNKKVFLKAYKTEDYLEFLVEMIGLPPPKVRNMIRNKNFLKYMIDKEPFLKK